MNRLCHCLLLALFGVGGTVAAAEPVFLKRTVTVGENTYGYRVYVPENFNPNRTYPVVLMLHGMGSKGDDNERQTFAALSNAIRNDPSRFDFIAVFPQARENTFWVGEMIEQAVKALDQTVAEFKADRRRLYLTGESMGGAGTWYAAARYPGKFAALVPIAGQILPLGTPKRLLVSPGMLPLYDAADAYVAFAKRSQMTPVWIFHGTEDQTIPVTESRKMAEALRTIHGDVRFTEYANEGHEIAPKVYLDAELWKWLLSQRLDK